jgi:hypothetical protein
MNVEFSAVDVSKPCEMTSKPRPEPCLGMSLGDSRLLPRWCPAYRQHEPGPGSRMERMKARPIPSAATSVARGRTPSGGIREEQSTEAWRAGGPARSSCEPPAYRSGSGSQGAGSFRLARGVNRKGGTA